MSQYSALVRVFVIFIVGCVLAAAIYWLRPKPEVRPQPSLKPVSVSVITANPVTYQAYIDTQGTVLPGREIDLVTEVAGRVVDVADGFANGSFFKAGDILVHLDDRDYQYQLVNANAQIAVAERELALEKGRARQAKREWRDLGSQEANALALREPQIKAAQAEVSRAIAQRNQDLLNIERTKIKAPFNGRIQETYVDLGQYVTAGTAIAKIYDESLAEIRLPLTNTQVALMGLPLDASIDTSIAPEVELSATVADKNYTWPVNLTRTEASVDTRTRFYFGIAEIPEPFNTQRYTSPLIMGLFVTARIAGKIFDNAVLIPEKAIDKKEFIYIVDAAMQLQQRKVNIIGKQHGSVWVQGDFNEGEQIVVSDVRVLKSGINVAPRLLDE